MEYLEEAGCKRRVIIHCCTVNAVAQEMLSRIDGADPELVTAGALLHDIGRAVDHSIMHAYIGSQIVSAYGLPTEIVDIVRKHTGAGLDEQDVKEMNLPPADYMPRTLEEKIVAHADNMVSDNRVVDHMHSVNKLRNKGADRGADRVEALHQELSRLYGEDMDVIPRRIGEIPDLPLARRMGVY
ncbi:MAG: HDIG domain-containing protein [Thermoplasmata archaeon]|nr:HDIG domain-containing protein [Thermoplasmata archaeon]